MTCDYAGALELAAVTDCWWPAGAPKGGDLYIQRSVRMNSLRLLARASAFKSSLRDRRQSHVIQAVLAPNFRRALSLGCGGPLRHSFEIVLTVLEAAASRARGNGK